MEPLTLTIITTLGSSTLACYLVYNVGQERIKNNVPPTIQSNNPGLHQARGAHMNILESMVMYLPVLWIASIYSLTLLAGGIGIIWLVSRILYALIYLSAPEKRMIPFLVSIICFFVTLLVAIYGLIF